MVMRSSVSAREHDRALTLARARADADIREEEQQHRHRDGHERSGTADTPGESGRSEHRPGDRETDLLRDERLGRRRPTQAGTVESAPHDREPLRPRAAT